MSKNIAFFTHYIAASLDKYLSCTSAYAKNALLGAGGHLEMVEFAHACAVQLEKRLGDITALEIPMSIWYYQMLETGFSIPARMLDASKLGLHLDFANRYAAAAPEEKAEVYVEELYKIMAAAPSDFTQIAKYLQQMILTIPPSGPTYAPPPPHYSQTYIPTPPQAGPVVPEHIVQMIGQMIVMASQFNQSVYNQHHFIHPNQPRRGSF